MSEAEMNNNVSHVSKNFIEEENNASTGSSLKVENCVTCKTLTLTFYFL